MKIMRNGFTTGSCAAAASKAAAFMLLSGREKTQIQIDTPAGETYAPKIEEITIGEDFVRCGVRKESGDDPDITNGILVFAKVSFADANEDKKTDVILKAGEGIGRVTCPGLDQPVGNAAINSVPR